MQEITLLLPGTKIYKHLLTVDVFDSYANYQGIQSGWFGQLVLDRFNMNRNLIAPNTAGGGDTMYQTRAAAGELGDLIICSGYVKCASGRVLFSCQPWLGKSAYNTEARTKLSSGFMFVPIEGCPYFYTLWDSYKQSHTTAPDLVWQEAVQAKNSLDYLMKHDKYLISPGKWYLPMMRKPSIHFRMKCEAPLKVSATIRYSKKICRMPKPLLLARNPNSCYDTKYNSIYNVIWTATITTLHK